LSEKRNSFSGLLTNKGFQDESMTKGGSYAIGTSTTLEFNKSQFQKRAHNPLLLAAGFDKECLPIPWLANRTLRLVFG
jgi:hypothetical protein